MLATAFVGALAYGALGSGDITWGAPAADVSAATQTATGDITWGDSTPATLGDITWGVAPAGTKA
ncbi:hypothetical protein [Streptomyces sp. NPDC058620]|uniref:hypothetical protein n=1 Tax=Streptomyces sp. NPDC058620 TaxID=3346560 RepID=UPI00364DFB71